jgi:hypothetical protein
VHRSQRRLALGSGSLQHDAAQGGAEPVMQITANRRRSSGDQPLSRLWVDGQPHHAYAGGWMVSRWRS